MNRDHRTRLAQATLRIVEEGGYTAPAGHRVELAPAIGACVQATRLWMPADLETLEHTVDPTTDRRAPATLEVVEETSMGGARRLLRNGGGVVGVLNFASARHPGGGFLSGSQAQEESLARSSALYASLTSATAQPYYDHHRNERSALYSDHMIVSPACPTFRNDAGDLMDDPMVITVITSPAPNAGALARNQPEAIGQLEDVFRQRMRRMLILAASIGCDQLVLGAWGCGVFANDPHMVSRLFAELLEAGSPLRHAFAHISFSIHDRAPGNPIVAAFRSAIEPHSLPAAARTASAALT